VIRVQCVTDVPFFVGARGHVDGEGVVWTSGAVQPRAKYPADRLVSFGAGFLVVEGLGNNLCKVLFASVGILEDRSI
jgi:hypothetical protein